MPLFHKQISFREEVLAIGFLHLCTDGLGAGSRGRTAKRAAEHPQGDIGCPWRRWISAVPVLYSHMLLGTGHRCSIAQFCPTLSDPMDCSTPGFPVLHHLPEHVQIHVHRVGDAVQPSRPLSPPSPAFNLSQHQGLFQWVGSVHQAAKVLELQLQHRFFQWIFRIDFL